MGERTLVTGKLRSADCMAATKVHVVVMNKKDFLALDNPLLSWMLDYDAVATVLKVGVGTSNELQLAVGEGELWGRQWEQG